MTDELTDLGPSLTPDASDRSLDELVGAKPSATSPKSPDAAPQVELPKNMIRGTLVQVDATFSALMQIERVDAQLLEPIADGLQPLAQYYATQAPSVTTLWIVAGLSVLSYAALKGQQIQAKRAKGKAHAEAEAPRVQE